MCRSSAVGPPAPPPRPPDRRRNLAHGNIRFPRTEALLDADPRPETTPAGCPPAFSHPCQPHRSPVHSPPDLAKASLCSPEEGEDRPMRFGCARGRVALLTGPLLLLGGLVQAGTQRDDD